MNQKNKKYLRGQNNKAKSSLKQVILYNLSNLLSLKPRPLPILVITIGQEIKQGLVRVPHNTVPKI